MIVAIVDVLSHELNIAQLKNLIRLHTGLKVLALPLQKQDSLPYHMQIILMKDK